MGGSPAKPRLNCHREVLAAAAARWPPRGSVAGDWHMPTGPAIRCPRTPLPSPSRAGMAQACSPPLPERSQARAPLARICATPRPTPLSPPACPPPAAGAHPAPAPPGAHRPPRWQPRRIPPSLPALARNPANNETWVNSRHRPSMPGDMTMRQTELHLTDEDRAAVDEIRRKGRHHAREVNRAHVLQSLDRGVPEAQIMAVLGLGRPAVWRTRLAYLQGGIDLAVFDLARPGRPRQYGTDDEARVMALACSAPPAGQKRWTLAQLECAARQEPGLGRMGRETVRRILRKTTANPGAG